MEGVRTMTFKQLCKEIERTKKELYNETKKRDEYIKENAPEHVIEYQNKWIAHYEKLLAKYSEMYYPAKKAEEEKMLKKIAKEQIKEKASTIGYIQEGSRIFGITPEGKKWYAEANHYGWTDRTKHCFTLFINGEMVFTSGTLETVVETVAQN